MKPQVRVSGDQWRYLGKIRNLEEVLAELRSLGDLTEERLSREWVVRRAVERDLQVGVEIVLDICHRLLALAGNAPVSTGRQAIESCVEIGVLESIGPYGEMIGFRNMVVHRYDRIEPKLLVELVNHRLHDFDTFKRQVLAYVARS